MGAQQRQERDRLVDQRDAQIALLVALVRALSDRVAVLEGVESTPIDRTLMLDVKNAALMSGLSESGVRKRIRERRVEHTWIGDRVFVTEVPTLRHAR